MVSGWGESLGRPRRGGQAVQAEVGYWSPFCAVFLNQRDANALVGLGKARGPE